LPIRVLTAASVNGMITPRRGECSLGLLRELSVPREVLEVQYALRRRHDAVLLGTEAVLVDDPSLTSHAIPGFDCVRVTLDPAGRIPPHYRILDGTARTLVGVSAATPGDYLELLAERGVEAVSCGEERVDLPGFFAALAARGLRDVLVEGGGRLNRILLDQGLVDEVNVLVMPVVLDSASVNLFEGGEETLRRLRLAGCERVGESEFVWLRYRAESAV
jgi:riboflavin-specific deaminase-like protein